MIRDSELFLMWPDKPRSDLDLSASIVHIKCKPGVVCVASDPLRTEMPSGILIPESGASVKRVQQNIEHQIDLDLEAFERNLNGYDPSVKSMVRARFREDRRNHLQQEDEAYGGNPQDRLRPDAGTVISSGVEGIFPGDRLILRPYHGLFLKQLETRSGFKVSDVRFFGVTHEIEHSLIARVRDTVEPLFDWMFMKRDLPTHGVHIWRPLSKERPKTARVWKGNGLDGKRIALDSHPNSALHFKWAPVEYEGIEVMKAIAENEDGSLRKQVYATIEDVETMERTA